MSIPSNLRAGAAPHYLPSIFSFPDPTTFPPVVECEEYCVGDSYVCVCVCVCVRVLTRPSADGFAPFGCAKFKQEHHLDHFLNSANSSY